MTPSLEQLCDANGIVWRYLDGAGQPKQAPDETCMALLTAMGMETRSETDVEKHLVQLKRQIAKRKLPEVQIVEVDTEFNLSGKFPEKSSWQIELEDGTLLEGVAQSDRMALPPLPLGVHTLRCHGNTCTLISAPAKLPTPNQGWGLMVPLYGLRSATNQGIGDYRDLEELAETLGPLGIDFLGINPVHAGFSDDPSAFSPYSPSSRQRLNPLHIMTEQTAEEVEVSNQNLSSEFCEDLIDYPILKVRKSTQLNSAFCVFQESGGSSHFDSFVKTEGKSLKDFATHQAISEVHGPYWHQWPMEYHSPDSPETQKFATDNETRIRFHSWLQWRASEQLKSAQEKATGCGMEFGLYLDLAVGTHPFGAETWADSSAFACGVSLGSPSDSFDASGQNWQLVPFNPKELVTRKFEPVIKTLRAQLRYAGVLRIDHILGFEQSFWIPDGLPGAYVTYPRDALLAIARIEAFRAKASIIGEDLGNVPDGLREALSESGILGCRVAFFERNWQDDKSFTAANEYSQLALASITTHDLPTLLGWRNGRDIEWRNKLKAISDLLAEAQQQDRNKDFEQFKKALSWSKSQSSANIGNMESDQEILLAAHQFLAETRSTLVAVQIEDVLELVEQPNLPGTIDEHPNWRRRLAKPAEEISRLPILQKISAAMQAASRGTPHKN